MGPYWSSSIWASMGLLGSLLVFMGPYGFLSALSGSFLVLMGSYESLCVFMCP